MELKIKLRHPEKVNKPINPIKKKPSWIRSKLTNSKEFFFTKTVVNQNKTGSLARSERVSKYNQLIRIEEEL